MSFLLDTHTHGGGIIGFLDEVVLHGLLDTLKLIPFLFLTYLLMEFIEHKAEDKTRAFVTRAGRLAPLAGGLFGAVPQCGFSAAAANLYTGRVIGLGALIAICLSTSDEMLPILISGEIPFYKVMLILLYKVIELKALGRSDCVGHIKPYKAQITIVCKNFLNLRLDFLLKAD